MIPFIVVVVIVGIVISAVRAEKLKKQKEEERRRKEEQRTSVYQSTAVAKKKPPVSTASVKRTDPFPAYKTDPFARAAEEKATLSSAQLNEWLLDFAAAEKAGAKRPAAKTRPVYARTLHASGFSYRQLRKLRGFVPQNRLHPIDCLPKRKPAALSCLLRNENFVPLPQEEKLRFFTAVADTYDCAYPLPPKDPTAHETYVSFYRGRD